MIAQSWRLVAVAVLLAGCAPPSRAPFPVAAASEVAKAPAAQPMVGPAIAAGAPAPPAQTPAIVVPADAIYVCVTESGGQRRQTVIEFPSPKVLDLCRRHPEMGPCQFERNACRKSGGRVYAANGAEITLATEAEYDKKVMRWTFH
jgi:hypothetical protein